MARVEREQDVISMLTNPQRMKQCSYFAGISVLTSFMLCREEKLQKAARDPTRWVDNQNFPSTSAIFAKFAFIGIIG